MKNSIKRKLKSLFENQQLNNLKNVNLNKLLATITFVSITVFLLTQLVINSVLTPLGAKLELLNNEKSNIIEENQEIEQSIAETQSLTVIKQVSEKKYSFNDTNSGNIRYISDTSVVANK
jgi:hypothetical protein